MVIDCDTLTPKRYRFNHRETGVNMKVLSIETVVSPDYKEEYLRMDTGHVALLVTFNDGQEEMHLQSRTGKRVQVGNTSWKAAERAIFNTNPTRCKF
jgi:hypothetical protein